MLRDPAAAALAQPASAPHVLIAANLGEDADMTAAIAGQRAGAIYGMSGISVEWLERLP